MNTILITSQVGTRIVPVQSWLFSKYAPDHKINWIDLGGRHLEKWCFNVAQGIRALNPTEYVLFMLDDHLIFDTINIPITISESLERLELGQRWSHHKNCIDRGDFMEFKKDTLYSVSTQPSIWKTAALLRVLGEIDSNPWKFETKGRCKAGIVKTPAMKFIAESAISGRRKGKVNLNGINPEDRDELIKIGLLKESEIVYKWT